LKRRNGGSRISPATALNKFCSIRTLNGVYTEFGIDPVKNSESCRILSHTFHRRPITIRITAWNAVQSFCNQYAFGILKNPVFSVLSGL
ncbi:hypothetical protein ACTQ33_17010, partial [Candidatus Avoscillospira sp. LCP25S3_F1]|uniref:hypothetical protein n=1 Tax=Candidatus Avoscillospira sp. LCP25S3_F1 TaxID=3438825 RepID=UPI003F92B58F